MKKILNDDWYLSLKEEFEKDYYLNLREILKKEYSTKKVFPPMNDIYNAIDYTSLTDTKVVILGQDPYHKQGQAHGLSFSVNTGVKIPPSLMNIYKELHTDLGIAIPKTGYLKQWTNQGVLLLNTALTVVEAQPNSHKNIGWSILTDRIIQIINDKDTPVVFILWGNNAISKKRLITNDKHLVLTSVHPSPLSANRGFFGSKPFSKTNEFLKSNNLKEIDWNIDNIY